MPDYNSYRATQPGMLHNLAEASCMSECVECVRLRGESAVAFAEYTTRKDELAMTRKTDKSFAVRRRAFDEARGRLGECHRREENHRAEAHSSYGSAEESSSTDDKFARLRESLDVNDGDGVQQAIFDLGAVHNDWEHIPDNVVERLLTLLRTDEMYRSPVASHVLNFFEFESSSLTDRQKWLCVGFLNAHGDEFEDLQSRHVIAELREGNYLKIKKTSEHHWNDNPTLKKR